jgi:hypothetical protein
MLQRRCTGKPARGTIANSGVCLVQNGDPERQQQTQSRNLRFMPGDPLSG